MRITASHILDWVATEAKVAQTDLPRWVRRLCFSAESTRQIAFPAGDSSFVPDWDGVLSSERGNAWVPAGASRWEIGCDQKILTKANKEYAKRTKNTAPDLRHACTFVFVTPRRWTKKKSWVSSQLTKGDWADVRVYDADDLEQWLEQSPAVALQFGEALGLLGTGVESCSHHWQTWAQQSTPVITTSAMFMGRNATQENLLVTIHAAQARQDMPGLVALRADSVQEAVAFAVAAIFTEKPLLDQTLVVCHEDGWRYVAANPQLRVAIAASPEVAAKPVARPGLLVLVPHASGNLPGKSSDNELNIERPNIYEFEKALVAIGMEESDAKRFALSCGRSWSVLRRQRAINPAIGNPDWLHVPQARSLAMLCLLGTWNASMEADREVVARLANCPYEEIECDLRVLAKLDDAPLLCIGAVWKAKSPLELLMLFGDRISRDQLDRFFSIALDLFSTPDPKLSMPDEERWMAAVHGKVHPYSGLLFDSISDALIKLAVRGQEQAGLAALNIGERVDRLVYKLLHDADDIRWLSLSSYLPALAEAAPGVFLDAIEVSLRKADAPVTRLLTETGDSGTTGACWHAGLLWALETLAWNPGRLARVALILAQLSHIPIKGNWGNTPGASLFGLFRAWLPYTAASLQGRIEVLDLLIKKDDEAAFAVVEALLPSLWQQMAFSATRPKWREDDAGTDNGVTEDEMYAMHDAAKERLFRLSAGKVHRIAKMLENTALRTPADMPRVLALTDSFLDKNDDDKEILRVALREIISWHRKYDHSPPAELDSWLLDAEARYNALAPSDLVVRHRWLFDKHWIDLPIKDDASNYERNEIALAQMRASALSELFQEQGLVDIKRMVMVCAEPRLVGATLIDLSLSGVNWPTWMVETGGDFVRCTPIVQCISAMLCGARSPRSGELLRAVLTIADQQVWSVERRARFLVLARSERETWQLLAEQEGETDAAYWQIVPAQGWYAADEVSYVMRCLLQAKRPRSALICCQSRKDHAEPQLLFTALQGFVAGQEPEGPMLESWRLGDLLDHLEKSGEIEKEPLVHLEFAILPALGYRQERRAVTLYQSIMSDPGLFVELITMVYKPRHGQPTVFHTEGEAVAARAAAKVARQVLKACTRMPGTTADGTIDPCVFTHYIDAVRELCGKTDRLEVGDLTLGEILAHAPSDDDGTWPFAPAREILDRPEFEDVRRGFAIGTWNKRGVTTRSPWDGGDQERNLANGFLDQARRVQSSFPNVASMLEGIARSYVNHGNREDNEANLRKESY